MEHIIEALRQFRANESISEEEMANFLLVQFKMGAFDSPTEKKSGRRGRKPKKPDGAEELSEPGHSDNEVS